MVASVPVCDVQVVQVVLVPPWLIYSINQSDSVHPTLSALFLAVFSTAMCVYDPQY